MLSAKEEEVRPSHHLKAIANQSPTGPLQASSCPSINPSSRNRVPILVKSLQALTRQVVKLGREVMQARLMPQK